MRMLMDDATRPHLPGGGVYGRSARKEIRNPVLALPAVRDFLMLPAEERRHAGILLRRLAGEADTEALQAWDRRRAMQAAYWRAVATYAKHVARAVDPAEKRGGAKDAAFTVLQTSKAGPSDARRAQRNPVLGLAAADDILALPLRQRALLAILLAQLADQAGRQAEEAWSARKGIMGAYWRNVSTFAKHLSQVLNRQVLNRLPQQR
jgi:hypothetical protein